LKVFTKLEDIERIPNAVVTTGSFDGVHVGHKVIIDRLNNLAREIDGESVLITFWPHPRKVLYPETAGKNLQMINSQKEKVRLLERAGLQNLVIVEFTKEFANTSSVSFVEDILIRRIGAKKIIVGFNHFFGRNKEGDYDLLNSMSAEHGFQVEEIPEQDIQNETVSSTKIRGALIDGYIQKANAYLDHHYEIFGLLRKDPKYCLTDSQPVYDMEIEEDNKLIPPQGYYAVSVKSENSFNKGLVFIEKVGETENSGCKNVKLIVFECEENLEDQCCEVLFAMKMNKEFKSPECDQLNNDINTMRESILDLIY
jgi:riboflavin kinase/FMN adenylyltransferase